MLTVDGLETAYGVSQVLFGVSFRVGAGEAEVGGTDMAGPPDLPARSPLPQATQYFGHTPLAILVPPCRRFVSSFLHLRDQGADRFARLAVFFPGRALIMKPGCQASRTDRQVNP
jgi:hypothetical protein